MASAVPAQPLTVEAAREIYRAEAAAALVAGIKVLYDGIRTMRRYGQLTLDRSS